MQSPDICALPGRSRWATLTFIESLYRLFRLVGRFHSTDTLKLCRQLRRYSYTWSQSGCWEVFPGCIISTKMNSVWSLELNERTSCRADEDHAQDGVATCSFFFDCTIICSWWLNCRAVLTKTAHMRQITKRKRSYRNELWDYEPRDISNKLSGLFDFSSGWLSSHAYSSPSSTYSCREVQSTTVTSTGE